MRVPEEPLRRVTSLKLKLGLLVSTSVLLAAALATLGAGVVPAWLSIPVTVLLALLVTQWLARGMIAPLRVMTTAARRMASGDHSAGVSTRVSTRSTDEVGELARAFSRMAGDLADVDRQRRELVANVSHELRTPLTALTALLENLHDGVTRSDPETLAPALQQAQRLGGLVDDLLDLARVDAGVVPLHRGPVALADLLRDAAAEAGAGARATARAVQVRTRVEPADLTAYADAARLHQVVANLLDNAVRHSPPGGTVTLHAATLPDDDPGGAGDPGGVRLEVVDEGPGIAPADRERVFERFGTAGAGASSTGGTGLGLAIARWAVDLHGGRIAVLDPPPGGGALVRVDLPGPHSTLPAPTPPRSTPMTSSPPPATTTPVPATTPAPPRAASPADDVFGGWWPDAAPGRPRVLLAGLAVGLLAAVSLPGAALGIGATLVLLAAGAIAWWVSPRRRSPYVVASVVVCLGLALVPVLRDAVWIAVLAVLAAGVLVPTALTDARTVRGAVVGCLAWPLAGLRGIPWLGRSVRDLAGPGQGAALARTVVVSLLGALVFGLLFAGADAVFGQWFRLVVPSLGDELVARSFVGVAVAGVVLAAAYLSLNPAPVDLAGRRRRSRRRYEWLAPLLVVDAVFVVFLVAQAAALVGGEEFVRRTTGLTYAEYAREGFWQLTAVTALTLVVVAVAGRGADRDRPGDRAWLRAAAGFLGVLALVVVASAMSRLSLYTDAYGLTRLRLLVWVFEGWLALVLVGVLAAGIRLRATWLPRVAVLGGAALVLGLALANPDGVVARVNLDRYAETGAVDWRYLTSLSADAAPALADQPARVQRCALPYDVAFPDEYDAPWSAWNLGRVRADALLGRVSAPAEACTPVP